VKRRLAAVAAEIVESAFEDHGAAGELLDFAESRVFEVSKAQSRSSFQSLHDEMPGTFDYVEAIMNRGGELTGTPSGFRDLDQMTGGLQAGELIVIAARPSMGKTAFALNIARNAAVDHGKKVAVFSLEMTTRSLIIRLLSSEAAIDFSSLRKGRLQTAADKLTAAEIWIDDSGSLDILEVKAKSRRLDAEHGLDLVILDYLQLAHAEGQRSRKDLEIAEISKGLKALAKELDIPVIALSQLNRGPEQRDPDKRRPMMGDLRESGAIEQDADVIAFIYRDIVYNKETEDPRLAEIIIEKQRNGPTGTVKLDFEGRFARFSDRAVREDDPGVAPGGGFTPPDDGFAPPGDGNDFGEPVF
jgi:replicative DNA helicase